MQYIIQQKLTEQVIASGDEASQTVLLLEGNWYFAPQSVDMTHLKITSRIYTCPYKGICYWIDLDAPDLKAKNIGWIYPNPASGYEAIKDRIGFYSRDTAGTLARTMVETTV